MRSGVAPATLPSGRHAAPGTVMPVAAGSARAMQVIEFHHRFSSRGSLAVAARKSASLDAPRTDSGRRPLMSTCTELPRFLKPLLAHCALLSDLLLQAVGPACALLCATNAPRCCIGALAASRRSRAPGRHIAEYAALGLWVRARGRLSGRFVVRERPLGAGSAPVLLGHRRCRYVGLSVVVYACSSAVLAPRPGSGSRRRCRADLVGGNACEYAAESPLTV